MMLKVTGLAVSDRHPYMFSAGLDKMVKCWDMEYNKVSVTHQLVHLGICNTFIAHNKLCCNTVLSLACIARSPEALHVSEALTRFFVTSRLPFGFLPGHPGHMLTDCNVQSSTVHVSVQLSILHQLPACPKLLCC